jgi:hypothetical protein
MKSPSAEWLGLAYGLSEVALGLLKRSATPSRLDDARRTKRLVPFVS